MHHSARAAAGVAFAGLVAVGLTACGSVIPSAAPQALVVGVEVSSDVPSAAGLRVDVDARADPQRVRLTDGPLPYAESFSVPLDRPFPLTGMSVEASAAPDAAWISCRITLDGDVVAEHRAEGAGATAVCEKTLRPGPQ